MAAVKQESMKIALVQSALAWGQVERNLENFESKLSEPLGCDVVVLPEMFVSGCVMGKRPREEAVAEKAAVAACFGEVEERMSVWARLQDAAVLGSTAVEEGGRFFNRLVVALPDGKRLYYDKRHCFRMGGESEHYSGGSRRLVFDFRGARIAPFVCYDLRFPVWSRNTEGYDLAVYVANWPASRREVWNVLLRARAIENQSFVAAVNCVGEDAGGLRYAGDSGVWDARGQVVAAAREYEEGIVVADCDLEALREFRRKFPVLEDRDEFRLEGGCEDVF